MSAGSGQFQPRRATTEPLWLRAVLLTFALGFLALFLLLPLVIVFGGLWLIRKLAKTPPGQARAQVAQHRLQAAGLRLVALPLVVAAAADAVHALGDVDHLEVGAERTHHRFGAFGRQPGQRIVEVGQRGVAFAAGYGARTHLFNIV